MTLEKNIKIFENLKIWKKKFENFEKSFRQFFCFSCFPRLLGLTRLLGWSLRSLVSDETRDPLAKVVPLLRCAMKFAYGIFETVGWTFCFGPRGPQKSGRLPGARVYTRDIRAGSFWIDGPHLKKTIDCVSTQWDMSKMWKPGFGRNFRNRRLNFLLWT